MPILPPAHFSTTALKERPSRRAQPDSLWFEGLSETNTANTSEKSKNEYDAETLGRRRISAWLTQEREKIINTLVLAPDTDTPGALP